MVGIVPRGALQRLLLRRERAQLQEQGGDVAERRVSSNCKGQSVPCAISHARSPEHDEAWFCHQARAEQYLASVEVSKVRGEWTDLTKSRIAVAELAEEWFGSPPQIKPTTRSGYRFALDKYVLPDGPNFSASWFTQVWTGPLRGRTFNAAVARCIVNDPTFPKVLCATLRIRRHHLRSLLERM